MATQPVQPGHIATVVTVLEMHNRPGLAPQAEQPLKLSRWRNPAPDKYRALFRRVGAPWLWYSRLANSDSEIVAATHRDITQVYAILDRNETEVGMLELTHPEPDWCSLDFFGFVPELAGKGYGSWLMAHAMTLGWKKQTRFIRVHTCTLDHPNALGFYQKAGFVATKREQETFPDPRLIGLIPRDAAPQIPIIE